MRQTHQQRYSHINTQHIAATPPAVIPVHTGNHLSTRTGCRVWKHTHRNRQHRTTQQQYVNVAITTSHTTCCTMGPRVREDDKIRDRKRLIDQSYKEEVGITKMRQDTSTRYSHIKNSAHSRHGPQLSFPCTRESIHPHAPDAAFGNILTEIDNIEQPNSNTLT